MKKALLDTSSAILLYKTGMLEHLLSTYTIFITESVFDEFARKGYPGYEFITRVREQNDIRVLDILPNIKLGEKRIKSLGQGEHDTVQHYQAGIGDFIITDDRKAALFCRQQNIPFINALLFPRILYFTGIIVESDCQKNFSRLLQCGRYSADIIDFAQKSSAADLQFFLP